MIYITLQQGLHTIISRMALPGNIMILIVESEPGGMGKHTVSEEDITEDFKLHRYWNSMDGFKLNKFANTARPGDYMKFSKGFFIKTRNKLDMKNKEIVFAKHL